MIFQAFDVQESFMHKTENISSEIYITNLYVFDIQTSNKETVRAFMTLAMIV